MPHRHHHPDAAPLGTPEQFAPEPDQAAMWAQVELPELGVAAPLAVPVSIDRPVVTLTQPSRVLTTAQQAVNDQGGRILNTNPARTGAFIRNLGAAKVYIAGEQQSCTPGQGWPILPGEVLTLETVHEVWCCSDGTNTGGSIATMQRLRDGG
jgi:hypothetical protein